MTRPYAEVIGDPISHSKSPLIHNFWLSKLGVDAEYRACHVRAEQLADYFGQRREDAVWRGCNVTMPHKESVGALIDSISRDAGRIGAINTVHRDGMDRLFGKNTDGPGFMEPLRAMLDLDQDDRAGIVLGAGGAARAITFALADAGLTVWVLARDTSQAAALMGDADAGPSWLEPEAYRLSNAQKMFTYGPGLLVNATSLGMNGNPSLDVSLEKFDENTIVYDIVYSPLETPLLVEARDRGMRTIDGLQMLVGQAALAFELFFGQPAPREHDAELRALLTS
jgi:shikimate dehydrogenase